MLGINPFELHGHGRSPFTRMPFARSQQPPAPSPTVTHSASKKAYTITVQAPDGCSLSHLRTKADVATGTLRIEGDLATTDTGLLHEYVTQRRMPVYEHGSTSSTSIGFIPAGSVLRGHAPSSRGWIALEGDDSGFICDDGSLVDRSGTVGTLPFVKSVELPSDALIEGAVTSGSRSRFRVRFSPRVAIRAGPGTEHNILGSFAEGDIVVGTRSTADSNWVALGGRGFVMVRHPRYGTLLDPLGPDVSQMTVTVPRRPPQPPHAPQQPAVRRPSTVDSRHSASHPRQPPTTRTPQQPQQSPPPDTVSSSAEVPPRPTPSPSAPAAGRAARAASGVYKHGLPDALYGEPLLLEVPASPEHVQRPEEACECFVAMPAGGFARTACEP